MEKRPGGGSRETNSAPAPSSGKANGGLLPPRDLVPHNEAQLLRLADAYFAYVRRRLPFLRLVRSEHVEFDAGPLPPLSFGGHRDGADSSCAVPHSGWTA